METPESTCPAPSARDQPAPAPGPPAAPSGQASPRLTLGPVILPLEQGLPPTVFLKALPIPLYHTVPPGGLQPRAPLVTGSLDGGNVPFILSPLLPPEGPGSTPLGKPAAPTLTVNIVGALPVLSSGLGPSLGHPGKVRNAGKYLCPHCGRDCLKPSVLEKHIRSHTGERPFPCATCRIAFKTQSNLYKHRRTQTHLNNSRLSLESEGAGGSLLEEGDRASEASTADGNSGSQRTGEGTPERPPSPGAHQSLGAKNRGPKTEAAPCPGSTLVHGEAPPDSAQMVSPGLPPAGTQPRWKLPEPKPCSLPRQQEGSWEKHWETKAPEGRLRKCESTDSGYLSRSDSAEQPALPPSPLHSLSEHSAESEGEGGLGPGPGDARAEPGAPGSNLELEKKQLEERIARLISHNQAVVGDPQLDHVRPRKTVLSKQGSIDLPTPYTYKDSFHFDIRALEPGRRRAALRPACSTFAPLDKSRPLFFHSVPTQLSTTVECVPVTRSNSLPFIEGSRTWPDPQDLQDNCPRTQKPLSPRPAPARLGYRSGLTLADVPSGHPRALVRQAAVEDLPCTPTGDTAAPSEDPGGKRGAAGEGALCRGRTSGKKCGPRKLKMFSQDKWRVYGNETFQRIYQKMKTSPQGGQKAREMRAPRDRPDLPSQEKTTGDQGTAPSQDTRTPTLGDISVEAKLGSWGSLPALEGSLDTEPPKQMRTVAIAVGSGQPGVARAVSSPALSHRDPPCLSSRNSLLSPDRALKTAWPLTPTSGPLGTGDRGAAGLVLQDPKLETGIPGGGGTKETGLRAHTVLRRPSGGSGEPWATEDKLPSGRKKPKVEGLGPQEQPEPLGAETPGDPVQAASPPSQKQDSDSGEMSGGPHGSAEQTARAPESSNASSGAPVASLTRAGPKDKPTPPPATMAPGHQALLATQPRAPSILTAPTDATFPPKYLLRVPQGETPSVLPVTQVPGQGPESLCPSGWPEEQTKPGTPGSPSPVPSGTDGIPECPSWSRQKDGRKEAQVGREEGEGTDAGTPAARESPSSATVGPLDTASFLPTPSDTHMTQNTGGKTDATHHLCTGSELARAGPSGGILNLWAPHWGIGGSPEKAPEDLLSEPRVALKPCCSFQPSSFLTALTRPQGMPLGQPEPALSPLVGTPRSCGVQSPFPSLRAEPRLTWCCLSRSRPLPAEQKEKAASVCLALHLPGPDVQPGSNRGRTRTGPGEGGLALTPKISYPATPGIRSQGQMSDPAQKKGLSHRRVKTSHGNSKQKRLRINPKRYEGTFWQSRAPLRASKLRKPLWVPRRSCPPPPLRGPERRGTPKHAGLNPQGEPCCTTSESSLGSGNEEKKEGDGSPSSSSRTVKEVDRLPVKDTCPSAGEHSGGSHPHDAAAASGLSLQSNGRLALAQDDPVPRGHGLPVGLPETQQLPSQGQIAIDPKPCTSSDAQEPPSFEPQRTFPRHDTATSAAPVCISLGAEAGHTILGTHSAEPQDHSWVAGETLAQSSPAGRVTEEDTSQTLLPGKLSSGPRISGSSPSGSTEKTHLEIPASGPSSTSPPQEEGGHQAVFPSRGQHECGEMATPRPPSRNDSEKCQTSGLITPKGHVTPLKPGQPSEVPEAPSRSIRKRSLEGMRKQTRVELSDTSSDDEDRLVIEI